MVAAGTTQSWRLRCSSDGRSGLQRGAGQPSRQRAPSQRRRLGRLPLAAAGPSWCLRLPLLQVPVPAWLRALQASLSPSLLLQLQALQ